MQPPPSHRQWTSRLAEGRRSWWMRWRKSWSCRLRPRRRRRPLRPARRSAAGGASGSRPATATAAQQPPRARFRRAGPEWRCGFPRCSWSCPRWFRLRSARNRLLSGPIYRSRRVGPARRASVGTAGIRTNMVVTLALVITRCRQPISISSIASVFRIVARSVSWRAPVAAAAQHRWTLTPGRYPRASWAASPHGTASGCRAWKPPRGAPCRTARRRRQASCAACETRRRHRSRRQARSRPRPRDRFVSPSLIVPHCLPRLQHRADLATPWRRVVCRSPASVRSPPQRVDSSTTKMSQAVQHPAWRFGLPRVEPGADDSGVVPAPRPRRSPSATRRAISRCAHVKFRLVSRCVYRGQIHGLSED